MFWRRSLLRYERIIFNEGNAFHNEMMDRRLYWFLDQLIIKSLTMLWFRLIPYCILWSHDNPFSLSYHTKSQHLYLCLKMRSAYNIFHDQYKCRSINLCSVSCANVIELYPFEDTTTIFIIIFDCEFPWKHSASLSRALLMHRQANP